MRIKSKILACAAAAPFLFANGNAQSDRPIHLTIDAPGGSILSENAKIKTKKKFKKALVKKNGKYNFKFKRKKRTFIKDKTPNLNTPTVFEEGYALSFRMAAPQSEAVIRADRFGAEFETLVLEDPDGCLDLSQATPGHLTPSFPLPSFEDCNPGGDPGYEPDELFINFTSDPFEAPGVQDTSGLCVGAVRDGLVDDAFGDELFTDSDTPYVDPRFVDGSAGIGPVFQVGPKTGGVATPGETTGPFHDCYGFGADDDNPSLVVMANVGAARVFDENLNYPAVARVRNLAGLASSVSSEPLDRGAATAIISHMPVTLNMLRPLTFVDLDGGFFGPFPSSVNITTQADDVETTASASGLMSTPDVVNAVFATFPNDYEIEVRAVVVKGVAPDFIDDTNGDGVVTADDLTFNGDYELLSNEAVIALNLLNYFVVVDQKDGSECPPSSTPFGSDQQLYVDLDGDGTSGVCNDGDGTSRSAIRFPR